MDVINLINIRGPKWLFAELVMGRNGYLPNGPRSGDFGAGSLLYKAI